MQHSGCSYRGKEALIARRSFHPVIGLSTDRVYELDHPSFCV